jgi:hypothetical protein
VILAELRMSSRKQAYNILKKSKPLLRSRLELRAVEACWSTFTMRVGSGAVEWFSIGEDQRAVMGDRRGSSLREQLEVQSP